MTIEETLLHALGNMVGSRPESPQRVWVVYDSDIPGLVRDIRAGLAGKPVPEVASDLPPSLAAKPNIPWEEKTLEQLRAEHDYWCAEISGAAAWGSLFGCAIEFRDGCAVWIARRERELSTEIDNRGCA